MKFRFIDILLDALILNVLVKSYLKFKATYITPRLDKLEGVIVVTKIKNKGIDFRIHGKCTIFRPEMLRVGDYVRIGKDAYLNCAGGLEIGNNCQISTNFTVHTRSHNYESDVLPYDKSFKNKSVYIGDSVWIGKHCTIVPGVRIGEGAIIGASTVVSKDVPPYAIVVGAQQRIIGYRDSDRYYTLKNQKLFHGKLFPDN